MVHHPMIVIDLMGDLLEIEGIETHPLIHHWEGWWSKIELFRYDDVFYLDLDTVILNDIRYMLDLDGFYALRNFGNFELKGNIVMGSGVMTWSKSPAHLYYDFDPSVSNKYRRHQNRWGDQGYIYDSLNGEYRAIQDAFPDRVHSYKWGLIDQNKPDADIICFHGRPRPWDVKKSWVPALKKT